MLAINIHNEHDTVPLAHTQYILVLHDHGILKAQSINDDHTSSNDHDAAQYIDSYIQACGVSRDDGPQSMGEELFRYL